jgi:hypothetical protein
LNFLALEHVRIFVMAQAAGALTYVQDAAAGVNLALERFRIFLEQHVEICQLISTASGSVHVAPSQGGPLPVMNGWTAPSALPRTSGAMNFIAYS